MAKNWFDCYGWTKWLVQGQNWGLPKSQLIKIGWMRSRNTRFNHERRFTNCFGLPEQTNRALRQCPYWHLGHFMAPLGQICSNRVGGMSIRLDPTRDHAEPTISANHRSQTGFWTFSAIFGPYGTRQMAQTPWVVGILSFQK